VKVHRVLAPNPGLFTGAGTNCWVVQSAGRAAVIDPGPAVPTHIDRILELVEDLEPVGVLVSHTHPDHAPAANEVARRMGVPAYGHAPGPGFAPDILVNDGDRIAIGAVSATVITTPGHTPDHVCYRIEDVIFSGDHVIGGSTVVIEDLQGYLDSLARLQGTGLEVIYPGHGEPLTEPDAVLSAYIDHRLMRERQIVRALEQGAATVGDIVDRVYSDIDRALHLAAAQSVGAHLRKLADDGIVVVPDHAIEWASSVKLQRRTGQR
jgi:glyoxylase-like metal-dependent hydrolase (beta-lactamase superfamily II)